MDYQQLSHAHVQEEHHSSYCYISHGLLPSSNLQLYRNQQSPGLGAQNQHCHFIPPTRSHNPLYTEIGASTSSFKSDVRYHQQKDALNEANKQELDGNGYVGACGSWDSYKGLITHDGMNQSIFGCCPPEQGANKHNSQQSFSNSPTPTIDKVSCTSL